MRTAVKLLIIVSAAAGAACHRQQEQRRQPEQNISIDNDADQNVDVEALPSDESSGTSSNELMKGSDNPDVNSTDENSD